MTLRALLADVWKEPICRQGAYLLMIFVLMSLAAPILPAINEMFDPLRGVDPDIRTSVPPQWPHLLGTDQMGRDLFSQLLHGARIALVVGISAATLAVALGTLIGLVSGYYGGLVDGLLMRFTDIVLILPGLPFLIILSASLGRQSVALVVVLIALFGWPGVARVIRSQVLSLRQRPFVEAALVSGVPTQRILLRHLLPPVLPLSVLYVTFGVSSAILTEAALSFIGLGDPSVPSWGMMLRWAQAQGYATKALYWMLPPGLCITLISLAFYLIGKGLEQRIIPRLRLYRA